MYTEAIDSNSFSRLKISMPPRNGHKLSAVGPFTSFMKSEEELKTDVFEKELIRKKEDALERRRALFLIFSLISLGVLATTTWLYLKIKS